MSKDFKIWWHREGSGMPPLKGEEACEHVERVSAIAWSNGAYKATEALKAENARLKAEVERLTAFTTRTIIPNEELQAQVERLTKAGDAMAAHIERNDERCYIVLPDGDIRISDWNAAKEGKHP
jgi:hypothetical protein